MKVVLDSPDLEEYKVLGHIEGGNGNFLFDKEWGIIVRSLETLNFPVKNRLRGVSKYTVRILLQCAVKVVFGSAVDLFSPFLIINFFSLFVGRIFGR
jgi:hypothetical protein